MGAVSFSRAMMVDGVIPLGRPEDVTFFRFCPPPVTMAVKC